MWKQATLIILLALCLVSTTSAITSISHTNISVSGTSTVVQFSALMNVTELHMTANQISLTNLYLKYDLYRNAVLNISKTYHNENISVLDGAYYSFQTCASNWQNTSVTWYACTIYDNQTGSFQEYDTAGCSPTVTNYSATQACNYCSPLNASYACYNSTHMLYNDSNWATCCAVTNLAGDCINGDDNTTWNNLYVEDATCYVPLFLKYDTQEGDKMNYYLILTGIGLFCAFMLYLSWYIISKLNEKFYPLAILTLSFFLMGLWLIGGTVLEGQQSCDLVVNETSTTASNTTYYTYQGLCVNDTSNTATLLYRVIMWFSIIAGFVLFVYLVWWIFEVANKKKGE